MSEQSQAVTATTSLNSLSEAERKRIRLQRFQMTKNEINTMDSLKVI